MKAGTSPYFIPQFNFSNASSNNSLSIKESPSSISPLSSSIATKDVHHHNYKTDDLSIHVEGIPSIGAKSRVETQMKLSIKLVSKKNEAQIPIHRWSYLRIPSLLLARSKMKKSQQQKLLDGSYAAMVSDESKVLNLEARVICENDEKKIIKMCQGCVRRERKRAERKKDAKPSTHSIKPGMVDEAFERDRQRILLFNCEPLVNFSAGEAIIPTRITCYCRHHNERTGFRVRFTVRDVTGRKIAYGETPPIMITDDHKTTQQRDPSDTTDIEQFARKRRKTRSPNLSESEERDMGLLITPASSRRSSMNIGEIGSTASSPSLSITLDFLPQENFLTSSSSSTTGPSVLQHFLEPPLPTPGEEFFNDHKTISPPQTPIVAAAKGLWKSVLDDSLYGHFQLPVFDNMSNLHHRRTKSIQTMTTPPALTQSITPRNSSLPLTCISSGDICISGTCNPSMVNNSNVVLQQSQTNVMCNHQQAPPIPILSTISPSQGSTYGGIEVTIMGQDFHQYLILMFGNRAATIIYWSPTCIVCLLPPAEQKGPVLLSFKEHSLIRPCETPPLFEYYEEGQRDIIDLTHQVLGIDLVQQSQFFPPCQELQQQDTELYLINLISQYRTHGSMLTGTNLGGQSLLHLAAYLNYPRLAYFLLSKNPSLIQSHDRNGLSPLHFSCQTKSTETIYALLNGGANVAHMSSIGTPMTLVAALLNPTEFQELENQIRFCIVNQGASNVLGWLPSLFVFAAKQYYRCSSNPLIDDNSSCYTNNLYPPETPLTTGETISFNNPNKASSITTCNINSIPPFL